MIIYNMSSHDCCTNCLKANVSMNTSANLEWLSTIRLQCTVEDEFIMRKVAPYICVKCYICLGKKLEFHRCTHCQSTLLRYQNGRVTAKCKQYCQIWHMHVQYPQLCITYKGDADKKHISGEICPRCSIEVSLVKCKPLPWYAPDTNCKYKFSKVPKTLCQACYRGNRHHHIMCSVCHKDKPFLRTQEEGACNDLQCNRCNKPICNDCIEESTFSCKLHHDSEVYHTLCSTCTTERLESCQRVLPSLMKEPRTCKGSICTLSRQGDMKFGKGHTYDLCSTCGAKLCMDCSKDSPYKVTEVTSYGITRNVSQLECLSCAYQDGGLYVKSGACSHSLIAATDRSCKACRARTECVDRYVFACTHPKCYISKTVHLCCRHVSSYQVGGKKCHLCRRRRCKSCVKENREYISTCRTCGELTCKPCCMLDGSASDSSIGVECLLCGQQRAVVEVIIPWWRERMYAPGSSYVKRVIESRFEEMQSEVPTRGPDPASEF